MVENVQNPGSAIGEAIGANMEAALNEYLIDFVKEYECHLVSTGPINSKTGKNKKLFLYDNFGTAYNIDAVIANEAMQPLIVIEYKYIRYKKHNRDKGSWLCTAHNAIRRRYSSIRSSIAILAGNWSGSSLAMMQSHDINLFLIPFEKITELLRKKDIEFDWGEKDRNTAIESWNKYSSLTSAQQLQIGKDMIQLIKPDLESAIQKTLDDSIPREVDKVSVEVHTNIGEVRRFEFNSIQDALEFLEDFGFDELFNAGDSFTLFDLPEIDK
ncbi:MAG: hypothetical protein ACOCUV_03510 [bacterium]